VPNFTEAEVADLFLQYQDESSQHVDPHVVAKLYSATRGQPGLVGWFGELLTETHNPGHGQAIGMEEWAEVYRRALNHEWNNTVLNLVKKARGEYQPHVLELFSRSDMEFRLDADWCNFLYLNGILDIETVENESGEREDICRFSSPFVQERLYNALTHDLVGHRTPILALEPLDDLADVFSGERLDLPALLERYKRYLQRLADKGLNPWKEQPRRADLHVTEAVGHFHLYSWLDAAIGKRCVVSPEFPTGNGKVHLHVRCGERRGIIEIKSFVDLYQLERSRERAAQYAMELGLTDVTLAVFVPTKDEEVLAELSGEHTVGGTRVHVVALGWSAEP